MSSEFAAVVRSLEDGTFPPDTRTDVATASLLATYPEWRAVETTDLTIAGRHGDIPVRLYRRPGAASVGFVWAHGGSWVGGDLDMPEANAVALALAAAGIPVLSVEYRKALNGVRFPVPSDDVLDAWNWAVENAAVLGVEGASLHLGGASAGADLAAGVALRLVAGEGAAPSSVLLAYPLVHSALPPVSEELAAALAGHDLGFDVAMIDEMTLNYVGDAALLADPVAFAGGATGERLSALPPFFLLNSEVDLLRASGDAFADQLRAAGVRTRSEFEPGAPHGHLDQPHSDWFRLSIDRMLDWLRSF